MTGVLRRRDQNTDKQMEDCKNTGRRRQLSTSMTTPWSWTSGFHNCEKINSCFLSHAVCGTCYDNLNKLISLLYLSENPRPNKVVRLSWAGISHYHHTLQYSVLWIKLIIQVTVWPPSALHLSFFPFCSDVGWSSGVIFYWFSSKTLG